MPERARAHRFEDGRAADSTDTERQLNRRSVSILLIGSLRTFLSNRSIGDQRRVGAESASKIGLKRLFLQGGHISSVGKPYSNAHRSGNLLAPVPAAFPLSRSAAVTDPR